MSGKVTAQRRSVCTLAGMAAGFRAFYAVMIDGGQLYGSGWISLAVALTMAFLPLTALIPLRRMNRKLSGTAAIGQAVGKTGRMIAGAILFAVLTYDAGASLRIMCSTGKYVAMPEANRVMIILVTAAAATAATLMGTAAVADAAVLWKRLAAALIVLLAGAQISYFRPAWLTPVFGPGFGRIADSALPAAGMFSLSAAGWLMMEPEHDRQGTALLKACAVSGLIAVMLAVMFGMLIPGLTEELPGRSFRLGRLLANDRAGLSLEMPYVVLLYSGMLTMLLFELTAASSALHMLAPKIRSEICVAAVGTLAFATAAGGAAEQNVVGAVSRWYYPAAAAPFLIAGASAWIRTRKDRRKGEAKA